MRTLAKIVVTVAVALTLGSGTALADDPVTRPTEPTEKCLPLIGCR